MIDNDEQFGDVIFTDVLYWRDIVESAIARKSVTETSCKGAHLR